ncbi:BadF/BadG/BcrA/BcrD ATPase family protein [Mesobacterium sp. TK19101]|uniref:BadF/BadG/BcrA/BcrD ATPase family protein n=1 Tax=Mesobacterium hydrothermale TaxID=3111907 RepID=A0ABU6HJ77_9RHOB|nr:BadF/BadG/BcrA/BcrD ATPase family protein [Mesobacterium sp. TK19101]MEC3862391.1 BadF/BadG/BcrA/BcrD ATPase family protein [Mesobacterium sp. TK19101]
MTQGAFIGVDCGGTTCRIAWSDGHRRVDYFGAGANFTTDADACAGAILDAAQKLADKAKLSLGTVCSAQAYLGVAGIVTEADAKALARALPFDGAVVEDDRNAMVFGALGARDGFVASIGTGSFFARKIGAEVTGIGGWGLTLGDEASGAWLGRGLLRMSMHAHDGLVPQTALTEAVLDEMGGPAAIVDFARDALPNEYARLAPGLAGAAEAGDPQGRALMADGAAWIEKALLVLGWTEGQPICLPGKLGAYYHHYLPAPMVADLVEPAGASLDGALALARLHHGAEAGA